WEGLRRPLRNPITVASLLGLAAALAGIELPEPIMQPISLVGAAAVPVALLAYGLGLSGARRGARPDDAGETTGRKDVALAVLLKCFVQPVAAYLTGLLLGLDGTMLFAATLFAALPPRPGRRAPRPPPPVRPAPRGRQHLRPPPPPRAGAAAPPPHARGARGALPPDRGGGGRAARRGARPAVPAGEPLPAGEAAA